MSQDLIIASEIPWGDIKGKDLEELLYWLFDSMGAKDLEWRIGGKGSGTSDQGRDLELSFYMSSPDGDLTKQKWWVEAKGRKATVEPSEVHEAVLNAAGKLYIDVLVIATNSNFSNPTRDWVREWQSSHPRPSVKLWEKTELENLCSKNPLAIIRLHSKALSNQGRLQVATTKLWDYANFTDEPTLIKLWKARSELEIKPKALFALLASEAANGKLIDRSWGVFVEKSILTGCLANGLVNFLYLAFRANEMGVRQYPIIKALAYMVLVATQRIGVEKTEMLLTTVWDDVDGREYPEQLRKIVLEPVIDHLNSELSDVCTSNCRRVDADKIDLTEKEAKNYWQRLSVSDSASNEDNHFLTFESQKEPCEVGFSVSNEQGCPLTSVENPEDDIHSFLLVVDKVSKYRRGEGKNV